jgi:Crinkler effector protein N-terminal domain
MPPKKTITLQCMIQGEYFTFSVKLPHDATISDLRDAIQKRRECDALKGISSHSLDLWNVCLVFQFLRFSLCLMFSSQANKDLATLGQESLRKLGTADLGENSKLLIGFEPLAELLEGLKVHSRLHIFVIIRDGTY